MQNKLRIAFFVAISFGLIAAYGVYDFLRGQRLAVESMREGTEGVVVARREIPAGAALLPEMLEVARYLKPSVPAGAFSSPEELTGKIVATKVTAGEPLVRSRLAERAGLTVLLAPGHRAMALKVNEIVGVSGFIAPEDRVDVIASVFPPGSNRSNGQVSKIVLQNKRVLSVAQKVESRNDGKPEIANSITLELTPEEAETLSLVSMEGQLLLALRSTQDSQIVQTAGRSTADVLGRSAARTTPAGSRSRYDVVVYHGSNRSVASF